MSPPGRFAPWMILVMILTGVAIWIVGKMALSNPGPVSRPALILDPSLAVKSGVRTRLDPVRQFTHAARTGMTLRELRWIVDDFQNAGLDLTDGDDALPPGLLAARQKRWYVDALGSALTLDALRKDEARRALAGLPAGGVRWDGVEPPLPDSCPEWLRLAAVSPWEMLPDLPAGTLGLARAPESDGKVADLQLPNLAWELFYPGQTLESPGAPPELLHAAYVFPFTFDQHFPDDAGGDPLAGLAVLHPAQFQMLLLIDGLPPGLAERLEAQAE